MARLFENHDGLVVERFADGLVSFDIFDAAQWAGTEEEALVYAETITRAVNCHDDLLSALKLLVADVADYEAWQRPCHALDVANAAIARATA